MPEADWGDRDIFSKTKPGTGLIASLDICCAASDSNHEDCNRMNPLYYCCGCSGSPICQLLVAGPPSVQPDCSQGMCYLIQHCVKGLPTDISLSLERQNYRYNPDRDQSSAVTSQRWQRPRNPYPSETAPCGFLWNWLYSFRRKRILRSSRVSLAK